VGLQLGEDSFLGAASLVEGRHSLGSDGLVRDDHLELIAVLVTKGIALEGTAILAQDFADVAYDLGLSDEELAEGREVMKSVSVMPETLSLAANGVSAIHDVTQGRMLETVLEIAHLSGVGMEIDGVRLPTPPIVARFGRALRFDPLRMISSGTLVATVPKNCLSSVQDALKQATSSGALRSDVASPWSETVMSHSTVNSRPSKMNWPICVVSTPVTHHTRKEPKTPNEKSHAAAQHRRSLPVSINSSSSIRRLFLSIGKP